MSFDANRYSVNFIHQCLMKAHVEPPVPERAGDNIDAVNAMYDAWRAGGNDGANTAWETLRKFVPHLDKPIKLINFNDLHMIKRPEYALPMNQADVIPPYAIYLDGLNVLYGQPGSGKSFVAIDISKHLSKLHPNRAVIYSAGEGVSGLFGRSEAWDIHHKTRCENMYLWDEAIPLLNPEAVEEFIHHVAPLNPLFITIDTLALAMDGQNENDTSVMTMLIKSANQLQKRLGCGILFIHHTGRAGYIRGSSALDGGVDSMLKLVAQDSLISVYNSLEHGGKNKHNPEISAIRLKIMPVEVSINEEKNLEAVVIPSSRVIEDAKIESLSDNQRLILEFLFDVGDPVQANQLIESVNIARRTLFRNLKKLEDSGHVEKTDNGVYSITAKGIESLGV